MDEIYLSEQLTQQHFIDGKLFGSQRGLFVRPYMLYGPDICLLDVIGDRVSFTLSCEVGHQEWDTKVDGVRIGMKSLAHTPRKNEGMRDNYGEVYAHCGPEIGKPGREDNHDLHGFLHLAKYNLPRVTWGNDGRDYIEIEAELSDGRASDWTTKASKRIYKGSGLITTTMEYINPLTESSSEIVFGGYQAHINLRAVPGSQIIRTASLDDIMILNEGDHPNVFEEMKSNPSKFDIVPNLADEEIIFGFESKQGVDDYSISMELLEEPIDGIVTRLREGRTVFSRAKLHSIVAMYKLEDFPFVKQWTRILHPDGSFAKDYDPYEAFGILPTTTIESGFSAAESAGHVFTLKPGKFRRWTTIHGGFNESETIEMIKKIRDV